MARQIEPLIKYMEQATTNAALRIPRDGRSDQAQHGSRLLDLEELDVEDERAVRRDAGNGPAAVGEVGGDGKAALTTDGHADDANVPALDDLALADLEGKRRALLVGYIVTG